MKYQYTGCDESVSQYDGIPFELGESVSARYIPALLACDRGNPFIEALPPFREQGALRAAYTRRLLSYDFDSVKKMTPYQRVMQVRQLRSIRFPMPFHLQLEQEFYSMLVSSYRERRVMKAKNDPVKYTAGNQVEKSSQVLLGDQGESTSAGITLTGYSGCGKSSAVHMLVSNYPQLIIHGNDKEGYFPQITYLVVNCVAGSNFNALYIGIAEELDKALGNIEPVYALEIEKTKGLGQKAIKICKLIERFAIGAIILDEIQYVSFSHGLENSFDSLLTIANKTKVGLMVIGTEEAREKIYSSLRVARRLGCKINATVYCSNRQFFHLMVTELFHYQWFDEPISLTDDIENALYEVTKGIVDQLISTYMCMNLEYLLKSKKPEINGNYVRKIAHKYYPGIQEILDNIDDGKEDEILKKLRTESQAALEEYLNTNAVQMKEAERLISESEETDKQSVQLKNVISSITALYDFTPAQIEQAFNKIIARKSAQGKTEREICRMVADILNQQPKRKASKANPKVPIDKMKSFLEESA